MPQPEYAAHDEWADDEREHAEVKDWYENHEMNSYVIWSHSEGMWWRANRQGYTSDLNHAGLYSAKEAGDITINYVPPGSQVAMLAQLAPACVGMLRRKSA